MKPVKLLAPNELDVSITYPDGLVRAVRQGLVDLTPWHILDRDIAIRRLRSMRERYRRRYVPFAGRQDNDDVACLEPTAPGRVIVVHDFAAEGSERRRDFESFWAWFRAAIEDMIEFE